MVINAGGLAQDLPNAHELEAAVPGVRMADDGSREIMCRRNLSLLSTLNTIQCCCRVVSGQTGLDGSLTGQNRAV